MMGNLNVSNYRKPNGPCIDCKDRVVNCHASCERYASWKAECVKRSDECTKARQKEKEVEEYTRKKVNRRRGKTPMW